MTKSTQTNFRETSKEEQFLYEHLFQCVQNKTPAEVIENFRLLFIEGKEYSDAKTIANLEKIVKSKDREESFPIVLDRCCRVIINHWYKKVETHWAIPELMALFTNINPPNTRIYRSSNNLRSFVYKFINTKEYFRLQKTAQFFVRSEESAAISSPNDGQHSYNVIGDLIQRYPYLYEYYLLGDNNIYEDWQTILKIQASNQQLSEFKLSQYLLYQARLIQVARNRQFSARILKPVKNPTILNEKELSTAIKQFKGKVDNSYSYKNSAQNFLAITKNLSVKAFKQELYQYLVSSIDTNYSNRYLNDKLVKKIASIIPDSNDSLINELLMMRICSQLLNFLVVNKIQNIDHHLFVDMVTNLGVTPTIGLLLKIALICPKAKPHLEKKFYLLFDHYNSSKITDVPWLAKSLENLQIALSINFGKLDLSVFKIT